MTPKDEVPLPTFETPGAGEDGMLIDARIFSCGTGYIAVVMPIDGWGALLNAMQAAQHADPDLATFYAGLKHGMGFQAPEELMRPGQPGLKS